MKGGGGGGGGGGGAGREREKIFTLAEMGKARF